MILFILSNSFLHTIATYTAHANHVFPELFGPMITWSGTDRSISASRIGPIPSIFSRISPPLPPLTAPHSGVQPPVASLLQPG